MMENVLKDVLTNGSVIKVLVLVFKIVQKITLDMTLIDFASRQLPVIRIMVSSTTMIRSVSKIAHRQSHHKCLSTSLENA